MSGILLVKANPMRAVKPALSRCAARMDVLYAVVFIKAGSVLSMNMGLQVVHREASHCADREDRFVCSVCAASSRAPAGEPPNMLSKSKVTVLFFLAPENSNKLKVKNGKSAGRTAVLHRRHARRAASAAMTG